MTKFRHNLLKNSFNSILFLGSLIFLASSCKTLDPSASLPLVNPPPASSEVNIPIQVPTTTLTSLVNQMLPPNLFSGEKMDLGNGIQGDLSFSRNGAILLNPLDSQRIQVTFPIRILGEVGLKPGGIRNLFQSKIPVDRALAPTLIINPQINSDWSIGISEFELMDLGGKVSLSALGMELDLSPMLRNEIRTVARQQLSARPDLISLKPMAESIWNQVGRPVFVDLGENRMAFSIRPDSIKLREYAVPQNGIHLDLGLKGQILSHTSDSAPNRPFPLPAISDNFDQSNKLEISIPLHLTYSQLDRMIKKSVEGQAIRINKKYLFSPLDFRTKAYGDRLGIEVDFQAVPQEGKPLNGTLFLAGKPVFEVSSQVLAFENVDFSVTSESSKASLAAKIKRGKIIRQLNSKMRFPLKGILEESLSGIKDRLAIRTPYADLGLSDLEVYPTGFYPANGGLDIRIKATGKVSILWK